MDNANKIISFILGLIVVVVFIAIVTGRFKIGNNAKKITKVSPTVTAKITPIPTKKAVITYTTQKQQAPVTGGYKSTTQGTQTPKTAPKAPIQYNTNSYQAAPSQIANNNLSTIPNTGAPTLLIPAALSMLAGGTFLKKLGKRK